MNAQEREAQELHNKNMTHVRFLAHNISCINFEHTSIYQILKIVYEIVKPERPKNDEFVKALKKALKIAEKGHSFISLCEGSSELYLQHLGRCLKKEMNSGYPLSLLFMA